MEKVCARFGGERNKACGPCWPLYLEDVASHRACRHPLATGKRNLPVGTRMGGAADSWAPGLGPQSPEDSRTRAGERTGAKSQDDTSTLRQPNEGGLHMSQGWTCPKAGGESGDSGVEISSSQNPKSQNNSWSSELPDRTVTPPTKPEPRRVFLRTTSG